MERVDHIDITEVSSCGLVRHVDGMFERQIPDGESFKFGITGFDAALKIVINLRETGCHFA